jgi:hypothetical protein
MAASTTPVFYKKSFGVSIHIVISKFKSYLLGTNLGNLCRYISRIYGGVLLSIESTLLDNQIPNRLLKLCVNHSPVILQ